MGQTFESLIVDRKLPERSNLVFYFQKPDSTQDYFKVTLPFFENIDVKESKKARFQKYNLISRSSQLYSYQGADSRQLSLRFNMTLPHIISVIKDTSFQKYQTFTQSEDMEEQRKLFSKVQINNVQSKVTTLVGDNYTQKLVKKEEVRQILNDPSFKQTGILDVEQLRLSARYGLGKNRGAVFANAEIQLNNAQNPQNFFTSIKQKKPAGLIDAAIAIGTTATEFAVTTLRSQTTLLADPTFKYKVIDLVTYWLNIIRSSCSNNTKNPIYGPPIIRLSHGIMYQDIPCICTDFSISYDNSHGFDVDTLLPRVITIEMKLEEVRTGDFGAGSDNYYITKDNLKGWESVISDPQQSMDPGYNYVLDELNSNRKIPSSKFVQGEDPMLETRVTGFPSPTVQYGTVQYGIPTGPSTN